MTAKCPRRSALLLLAILAFPAGAEPSRKYYYEDIFLPFFVRDEKAGVYRSQRPGAAQSQFPIRKAADAFRVFVIGGSIAGTYMGRRDALGRTLRRLLPAQRIEAINCGMPGYETGREAMLLEEVLDYEPDLIVLMTGHNETASATPPLWILHAADRLSKLKAYQLLVEELHRSRGGAESREAEGVRVLAKFRDNLAQMVRRAAAQGVPIALVSPPLNTRDAPSNTPAPMAEADFVRGWFFYLRGENAKAVEAWKAFLARLPDDGRERGRTWALFYLGRASERQGNIAEAARYYDEALAADRDSGPLRCLRQCQEAIHDAAGKEGAFWVDMDGAFRRAAAPSLPGLEMIFDGVHWSRRYDLLASLAIVDALLGEERLRKLPWDRRRLEALRRDAARHPDSAEPEDELGTLRTAISHMGRAERPFEERNRLSWRAIVYLERLYRRHPRWFRDVGRLAAMAAEHSEAKGAAWSMPPLSPQPALMHWHIGELHLRLGDAARARVFRQSRVAGPGRPSRPAERKLGFGHARGPGRGPG